MTTIFRYQVKALLALETVNARSLENVGLDVFDSKQPNIITVNFKYSKESGMPHLKRLFNFILGISILCFL